MFDRILKEMRDKIRRLEYIVSIPADEEMNDDCLTIFDVEVFHYKKLLLKRISSGNKRFGGDFSIPQQQVNFGSAMFL
jgi:hypothetical protein